MPARAVRPWSRIVDVVFPPRCLLCGEACAPLQHLGQVCPACVAALPWIRGPTCERCGIELVSERGLCTRCRAGTLGIDRNVALFPYLGQVRELIHLYKTAGRRSLAELFSELLACAYLREYGGSTVVPVPGRAAVRRRRGWEHVDLVASRLDRRFGIPVARCLRRRSTAQQKALDYEERLRNIAGTYAALSGPVPEVAVLLDDVLTTGATLTECARVLRDRGCRLVSALTIAVDE